MALTSEHAARVLDLDMTASVADVQSARRKLAKQYHPDCCPDTERATRHMARVNAAADTLIAFLEEKEKEQRAAAEKQAQEEFLAMRRRARRAFRQAKQAADAKPEPASDQPTAHMAIAAPVVVRQVTPADSKLARFAAQAYSSVLSQISGKAQGPTVDVIALRDTSFA